MCEVQLHLDGDRVPLGGGGKVGRQQEPEHPEKRSTDPARREAKNLRNTPATHHLVSHMSSAAFTQLVDAHYGGLFRFALSLSRNSADASDLTQQTFYVWATKGHAVRDASKVKSWLFTTLYREFLRGRRRGERMTALDNVPEPEAQESSLSPNVVESMDASLVVAALQQVDDVFRAPLTLFYLEELSYQEIADTLDIPIGTVMSRLSRGKAQLRAQLAVKENTKVISFPGTRRTSNG